MHVHLDPVGGVAGDMFAAALLDAFPEHAGGLATDLARAGLDAIATVEVVSHDDGTLTGSRFLVHTPHEHHPHRAFAEIRTLLADAGLDSAVRDRALAIFGVLAEAEGAVHGRDPGAVTFHEVGAWDSIVDIVSSAWLIEAIGAKRWTCGPLPLGSGTVGSAHGSLPVPAPATAILLTGFPCVQDGVAGERVTPTGAAILRHLEPSFDGEFTAGTLERTGMGFGTRSLEGLANVLRVLAFSTAPGPTPAPGRWGGDRVAVCSFEVDDQTPEDLAVGLDRLREEPEVLDVTQAPVLGKNGRVAARVQVLARPGGLDDALDACFRETTTLGVRWQVIDRAVLVRDEATEEVGGRSIRVKTARRPDGTRTAKAAIDDLARAGSHARREAIRHGAEGRPEHDGTEGSGG